MAAKPKVQLTWAGYRTMVRSIDNLYNGYPGDGSPHLDDDDTLVCLSLPLTLDCDDFSVVLEADGITLS